MTNEPDARSRPPLRHRKGVSKLGRLVKRAALIVAAVATTAVGINAPAEASVVSSQRTWTTEKTIPTGADGPALTATTTYVETVERGPTTNLCVNDSCAPPAMQCRNLAAVYSIGSDTIFGGRVSLVEYKFSWKWCYRDGEVVNVTHNFVRNRISPDIDDFKEFAARPNERTDAGIIVTYDGYFHCCAKVFGVSPPEKFFRPIVSQLFFAGGFIERSSGIDRIAISD